MSRDEIIAVIAGVFKGLEESGLLNSHVDVNEDVVLIGPGSVLDSIAFVTLFTDLEDRLSEITGRDVYLMIGEVHEFNPEDTFLTVGVLINYIDKALNQE